MPQRAPRIEDPALRRSGSGSGDAPGRRHRRRAGARPREVLWGARLGHHQRPRRARRHEDPRRNDDRLGARGEGRGRWLVVDRRSSTDPTPLTFTVDRLPVAGGPVDRSEAGRQQLTLAASSLGAPAAVRPRLPRRCRKHHDRWPARRPTAPTIAAWVNGRLVGATAVLPAARGSCRSPPGTTGIRFTVDGLPDAARPLQLGPGRRAVLDHPCHVGAGDRARDDARWRFTRQRADGQRERAPARPGALITATSDGRVMGRTTVGANGGWSMRGLRWHVRPPLRGQSREIDVRDLICSDSPGRRNLRPAGLVRSREGINWAKRRADWSGAAPRDPLQHEVREHTPLERQRVPGRGHPRAR